MDSSSIQAAFTSISAAIELFKNIRDLLPSREAKEALDGNLAEIEKHKKFAEAEIAKALDYPLCRCTFPPQVMLSKGYRGTTEYFSCPQCGEEYPQGHHRNQNFGRIIPRRD